MRFLLLSPRDPDISLAFCLASPPHPTSLPHIFIPFPVAGASFRTSQIHGSSHGAKATGLKVGIRARGIPASASSSSLPNPSAATTISRRDPRSSIKILCVLLADRSFYVSRDGTFER